MHIMSIEEMLSEHVRGLEEEGGPWMMMADGKAVQLLNPQPESFELPTLAHHLSLICRYTGATVTHYSVAQHLVLSTTICRIILNESEAVRRHTVDYYNQLLGTALHDGEEAVTSDLSSPVKAVIDGNYRAVANDVRMAIYKRFDVDYAWHNMTVKQADLHALLVERYFLLPNSDKWPRAPKSKLLIDGLNCWPAKVAAKYWHDLVLELLRLRSLAETEEQAA